MAGDSNIIMLVLNQFSANSEVSFMLSCTILVQLMTPGLALFYAGLCRPSGAVTMMAKSTAAMGIITLVWFGFAFGLAFGPGWNGSSFIGDPRSCVAFSCLSEYMPAFEGSTALGLPNLPGWLFALYQNKFAVITPALCSGAVADRLTLWPWIVFIVVWVIVVYAPWCKMVWGGGYFQQLGVFDFAGGIVVHTTSGWSALAMAKALGPRKHQEVTPHSVPMVLIGTALLWFGWFGFNAGSAYSPDGVAITSALNSQLAASVSMVVWLCLHYYSTGMLGLLPLCIGSIAGLAAVTPAAGFVQPLEACLIGGVSSVICFMAVELASKSHIDDALDVWGVHGVGGGVGSIMLGFLADPKACLDKETAPSFCVNPGTVASIDGQTQKQAFAVAVCALYSAVVSYVLILLIKQFFRLYPSHAIFVDEELGEKAYHHHIEGNAVKEPLVQGRWETKPDGSKSFITAPAEEFYMTPDAAYSPPVVGSNEKFENGALDPILGAMPQKGKIIAEYVWLGGAETTGGLDMRSKSRTFDKKPTSLSELPIWNFDGSSTNQAPGDDSEVLLKPCAVYPDPFRGGQNILVLCECMDPKMKPIPSNTRNKCADICAKVASHVPWFGIEQEYTLFEKDGVTPLGWPVGGEPKPQGPYYCSAGYDVSYGRAIMETHYKVCLAAGINISGTNAEVMPGQWEYQVGPCTGIDAGDQLWMSRFLMVRVCELLQVNITFDPKPIPGDWNGAGCHTNYSTAAMRKSGGYKEIIKAIEKLGPKHEEHIRIYGEGNDRRLTGKCETASITAFSYGVANRGASVRIPRSAEQEGKGYFEDRRPASNMDPYLVTGKILETTLLN